MRNFDNLKAGVLARVTEFKAHQNSAFGRVCAGIGLLTVGTLASATTTVSIPDTGIDVAGYVTAAITAVGAVIAVCVGGYFAFLVIKKAIRWAGRALG